MAMNRSQFFQQLSDGLNSVFGIEYRRYPQEWASCFDTQTSNKAWETDVLTVGLGPAQVKQEGAPSAYDEGGESWAYTYHHETISLHFSLTEEAEEDNLYGSQGRRYSAALARSMAHTKEVKGAEVYNTAFTTFLTGDGVAACATDHPLWGGGTFQNELTTAADLDESALEDALIRISLFVDDRGLPIMVNGRSLLVHPSNVFNAHRVLKSPGSTEATGDRDETNNTNAIRDMGLLPGGVVVNHYLTDEAPWFIRTDISNGPIVMQRKKLARGLDGDFLTGNVRYKARERYSFGITDPRGLFGSPGA